MAEGHLPGECIADEPHHPGIVEALALIQREFRRSPTTRELAEVAGWSPFHFHRLFRAAVGTTPRQMILRLKVAEVQRLALGGTLFRDAAAAAGFASQTHMIMTFKRVVGMMPRQWLREQTHRPSRPGWSP
jgi:AraC family transcriptional regulator